MTQVTTNLTSQPVFNKKMFIIYRFVIFLAQLTISIIRLYPIRSTSVRYKRAQRLEDIFRSDNGRVEQFFF